MKIFLQYLFTKFRTRRSRDLRKDAKNREIKECFLLKSIKIFFKVVLKIQIDFQKKLLRGLIKNPLQYICIKFRSFKASLFERERVHKLIYRWTLKTSSLLYNVWKHEKKVLQKCGISAKDRNNYKLFDKVNLLQLVENGTFRLYFFKVFN